MTRVEAVVSIGLLFSCSELKASIVSADLCQASWVTAQREELPPGIRMLFAGGRSFRDGDSDYAAAIAFTETSVATLVVFHLESDDTATPIHELRFEFPFDEVAETLRDTSDACAVPDLSPTLSVSVMDLDSDGHPELILQTNESKNCTRCLNRVRALQFDGASVQIVVDEPYIQLQAADGEGMILESLIPGVAGREIATRKTYFRDVKN